MQIDREIGAKSKKTKLRHWEAKQTDFLDFEICLTIQQKLSVSLLFLWQITLLGVELLSVPTINFPI